MGDFSNSTFHDETKARKWLERERGSIHGAIHDVGIEALWFHLRQSGSLKSTANSFLMRLSAILSSNPAISPVLNTLTAASRAGRSWDGISSRLPYLRGIGLVHLSRPAVRHAIRRAARQ